MKVYLSACPRCRENGRDTRGDNLANYPDGSTHCFSCHFHTFPKHYVPRRIETNVQKNLLPTDFTREVSAAGLKWLLQYGLPWSYWKDQIGYSPSEERLVFTVGNPLQFSIGRYVGPPKPNARKWYVYGDSHRHAEVVRPQEACSNWIVLVEDIVSAHKVASAGYTSIPLFGTRWYPCHIMYLINQQNPVVWWLDKDQQGSIIVLWLDKDQQGTLMRKALGLQALLGQCVKTVSTDKDPKELTLEQIKKELS